MVRPYINYRQIQTFFRYRYLKYRKLRVVQSVFKRAVGQYCLERIQGKGRMEPAAKMPIHKGKRFLKIIVSYIEKQPIISLSIPTQSCILKARDFPHASFVYWAVIHMKILAATLWRFCWTNTECTEETSSHAQPKRFPKSHARERGGPQTCRKMLRCH